MTKSKVFRNLKYLAYFIGFPLMSIVMLITFIPMLDPAFMGNFAIIWIVVTLAIWAFVAIVQYVLYLTLSKNWGGVKRDIANLSVTVIAILAILVPGAIYGAVQGKEFDNMLQTAKAQGITLDSRGHLMGWYNNFTGGGNAIKGLQADVDSFISDYRLLGWDTKNFGTADDKVAGIGYYPGVLDKIQDELKRKDEAYKALQNALAARKAVEDANEEILKPLRDAFNEAKEAYDNNYDALDSLIKNYYKPLNDAFNNSINPALAQISLRLDNPSMGIAAAIDKAIADANTVLGSGATAAEDNTLADSFKTAVEQVIPMMQELISVSADAFNNIGNQDYLKTLVGKSDNIWSAKDNINSALDIIINTLKGTVTAENAQTVLNQATSAKTAYDAFITDFNNLRNGETDSISFYSAKATSLYVEKTNETKKLKNDLNSAQTEYQNMVASQVSSYYPFDGYPTSIPLVKTETKTVYTATVPNLVQKLGLNLTTSTPEFVWTADGESVITSDTPFTYAVYTTGDLYADMGGGDPFFAYVFKENKSAKKTQITTKSVPLIDTVLKVFGIDYRQLTASVGSINDLPASGITFTRPDNVDQLVEWLVQTLPQTFFNVDLNKLLGTEITFDKVNSLLGVVYNYIYPEVPVLDEKGNPVMIQAVDPETGEPLVDENGDPVMVQKTKREVNTEIDKAVSSLLGMDGLLGFIMPMWDMHIALCQGETPDYFSSLLLTLGWALDTRIGLGDMLYGVLPQNIDIVLGTGSVGKAQAEYDSGWTVQQLKTLQLKLDNYPQVIAFADYWHVSLIFSGVVTLSMLMFMYFGMKQKQYALPEQKEE